MSGFLGLEPGQGGFLLRGRAGWAFLLGRIFFLLIRLLLPFKEHEVGSLDGFVCGLFLERHLARNRCFRRSGYLSLACTVSASIEKSLQQEFSQSHIWDILPKNFPVFTCSPFSDFHLTNMGYQDVNDLTSWQSFRKQTFFGQISRPKNFPVSTGATLTVHLTRCKSQVRVHAELLRDQHLELLSSDVSVQALVVSDGRLCARNVAIVLNMLAPRCSREYRGVIWVLSRPCLPRIRHSASFRKHVGPERSSP